MSYVGPRPCAETGCTATISGPGYQLCRRHAKYREWVRYRRRDLERAVPKWARRGNPEKAAHWARELAEFERQASA